MPITPTDIDPGDDTIGMRPNSYLAKLKDERSQSLYNVLADRIFKRAMSELTFPQARAAKGLEATSLVAYLKEVKEDDSTQIEEAIKRHIKTRVSEMILENVNYASPAESDPHSLAKFLGSHFSSWLSEIRAESEGISKLNAIAKEEIAAFRKSAVGKTA